MLKNKSHWIGNKLMILSSCATSCNSTASLDEPGRLNNDAGNILIFELVENYSKILIKSNNFKSYKFVSTFFFGLLFVFLLYLSADQFIKLSSFFLSVTFLHNVLQTKQRYVKEVVRCLVILRQEPFHRQE